MEPSTNDLARQAVIMGLGSTGTAGKMTGALVGLLWPASGEDVWSSIRARVEAVVNSKIAEFEYGLVSDDLRGLKAAMDLYHARLIDSTHKTELISEQYTATATAFVTARPHFRAQNYAVMLLPLFAQFANLHLALLRDGVRHGAEWGWPQERIDAEAALLGQLVDEYGANAVTTYMAGLLPWFGQTLSREGWTGSNRYNREMTLSVIDHKHYWPSFKPGAPPPEPPTRTIYSDPIGGEPVDPIVLSEPPAGPLTYVEAHGHYTLWGLKAGYGGNPPVYTGWVEPGGGSPLIARGLSVNTAVPITSVQAGLQRYKRRTENLDPPILDRWGCRSLILTFGTQPVMMFEGNNGDDHLPMLDEFQTIEAAYSDHVVSSLRVFGQYEATIVVGFKLKMAVS